MRFGALPRGLDTDDLLAAVGNNTGNDSGHGYAFGHALAADLLFKALGRGHGGSRKDSQGSGVYVDALIFPLGYCIRHFVELSLKSAIRDAHGLRGESVRINKSHRLVDIWRDFERACSHDRRLLRHLTVLKPLVDSVHAVDPTGQAFRYHVSASGHVHLGDTAVIHLRSLEKTFVALRRALDELDNKLDFLAEEYFTGTFTAKLSRADLISIAESIRLAYDPADRGWMTRFRKKVREEYGLTGSEFAEADSLIESHPFLSYRSGVERPLKELTSETMTVLMWALVAIPEDDLLSQAEWAGLAGVADVIRPLGYPEFYAWEVDRYLQRDGRISRSDVARFITKRPEAFVQALKRLGQPTLADAFMTAWAPEGA